MSSHRETIGFEESRLLYLAKGQYDHGIHGGTFTPGYVRKETGLGYNIIDSALESLVSDKLLERSSISAFRQGAPVEIALFRITEMGLQTVERIKSGTVQVGGGVGARTDSGDGARGPKARHGDRQDAQSSVMQSAKNIEAVLAKALQRTIELHAKIDGIVGLFVEPAAEDGKEGVVRRPASKPPGHRSRTHWVPVVTTIIDLSRQRKVVLSGEIEEPYAQRCGEMGLAPKRGQSFGHLLKSMSADGLVSLKLAGCRELGIKGHGSRLVVALTEKGEGLLKETAPVGKNE